MQAKVLKIKRKRNLKQLKIIFSGGGTGGHIFPAVAIANEIRRLIPESEILFVGALGKMEMDKVPAAGYKIVGIPIAGFQRKFTFSNLKLPWLILKSLLKTHSIINQFKPDVVVGTGGYASGPLLRSALSKKIPVLIQEQNSYAGITNKLLAKQASKICVAYEGMERYFPKEKIVLTGNPVRKEVVDIQNKREEGYTYFKLDKNKKTVLIVGGSLGAKAINEAIGIGLKQFVEHSIQVVWQTGKVYFETAKLQIGAFKENEIKVVEFITRMDLAYACADTVVSRAGAGAISELCLVQKPSILVPLPTAAEDHQTKNAMALVTKNAALLIRDEDCKTDLVRTAIELVTNETKKESLKSNIGSLAYKDSAERIANEVLKLATYSVS